jgi:microcystin-dependent protein
MFRDVATIAIAIAGLVLGPGASEPCAAQARECASLLQFGVYDYIQEHSLATSSRAARSAMCESRDEARVDRVEGGGGADVNVFGIVRVMADGRGSDEYTRILRQLMCSDAQLNEADLRTFATDIRLVNADVMASYRECLRLSQDGLRVVTDVRADFLNVTIGVRYTGGARSTIQRVVVEPANAFACQGSLADIRSSAPLTGTLVSMNCARTNTVVNGTPTAPAATISVHTDSDVVVRHFAALTPRPVRVPGAPPIGSIVAYAGSLDSIPVGWIPCDGRVLPNTRFPELARVLATRFGGDVARETFAVPDLRGRFIRGLNGDATGEGRDADGASRVLGSLQLDSTRLPRTPFTTGGGGHAHHGVSIDSPDDQNTVHESTDPSGGELDIRNPRSVGGGEHGHTIDGGGDAETRPANLAVLFIIHAGVPR